MDPAGTHTHLLCAAFKDHVLLALVQPPFLQGPEVEDSVLSLQEFIQNGYTHTHTHAETRLITHREAQTGSDFTCKRPFHTGAASFPIVSRTDL